MTHVAAGLDCLIALYAFPFTKHLIHWLFYSSWDFFLFVFIIFASSIVAAKLGCKTELSTSPFNIHLIHSSFFCSLFFLSFHLCFFNCEHICDKETKQSSPFNKLYTLALLFLWVCFLFPCFIFVSSIVLLEPLLFTINL